MLTFVLLVVLAVGVGLIAVFAAEEGHLATEFGERRREATRRRAARHHRDDDPGPLALPELDAESGIEGDPVPSGSTVTAPEGASRPRVRGMSAPAAKRIPKPYVAVEGRFEDVGRASLARRMASLMAIAVIVVALAVGSAAILAALFGAIAEMLDAAIG